MQILGKNLGPHSCMKADTQNKEDRKADIMDRFNAVVDKITNPAPSKDPRF